MHKHAFIVALLAGAGALLIVLGSVLSLSLLSAAGPYLGRSEVSANTTGNPPPPSFTSVLQDNSMLIEEVGPDGQPTRIVHASPLSDHVADFTLYAVPQAHYSGKIYVQAAQDEDASTFIVYPLDVDSGTVLPATINTPSRLAVLSPNQERVAVVDTSAGTRLTIFDLIGGTTLGTWTPDTLGSVSGTAGVWQDNNCFAGYCVGTGN